MLQFTGLLKHILRHNQVAFCYDSELIMSMKFAAIQRSMETRLRHNQVAFSLPELILNMSIAVEAHLRDNQVTFSIQTHAPRFSLKCVSMLRWTAAKLMHHCLCHEVKEHLRFNEELLCCLPAAHLQAHNKEVW